VSGFVDQLPFMAVLFLLIFTLNLLPAFAPPTWMALSFVGLTYPDIPALNLAFLGATAAMLGRITLARLAYRLVRGNFLDDRQRRNLDAIKNKIEVHHTFTFGLFLAYAFSPLPSNYLFIAYGLTSQRVALVAVPFFVGRLISYTFWVKTASAVGDALNLDLFESASYASIYFLVSQLLLIPVIYAFTKFDWVSLFEQGHFRWLR
jgi:hypothetical protein